MKILWLALSYQRISNCNQKRFKFVKIYHGIIKYLFRTIKLPNKLKLDGGSSIKWTSRSNCANAIAELKIRFSLNLKYSLNQNLISNRKMTSMNVILTINWPQIKFLRKSFIWKFLFKDLNWLHKRIVSLLRVMSTSV